MSYQGKTKKQVEYSNIMVGLSVMGLTLLLGVVLVIGVFL